jgi:hypothetical protein
MDSSGHDYSAKVSTKSGELQSFSRDVTTGVLLLFLTSKTSLLLLLAVPCCGEVLADSVLSPTWTWDFAKDNCACEPCSLGCPPGDQTPRDFGLAYVFDPPIGWALMAPSGGQPLGAIPIDSVRAAPVDGYVQFIDANDNEELTIGHTYVLRTMAGWHALITPLSISIPAGMTFIYKVQTDGTGIFIPDTKVSQTTWGSIKGAFKSGKGRWRE